MEEGIEGHYEVNSDGIWKWSNGIIAGETYRFDASDYLLISWQKVGTKWYYFGTDGAMVKNRWEGNYYLLPNGTMATNRWIGNYYVDANGVWDRTR